MEHAHLEHCAPVRVTTSASDATRTPAAIQGHHVHVQATRTAGLSVRQWQRDGSEAAAARLVVFLPAELGAGAVLRARTVDQQGI